MLVCLSGGSIAGALWINSDGIALPFVVAASTAAAVLALLVHARRQADAPACRIPPVMSRQQLITAGHRVLKRCRARQQPLSLAVVEVADLAEARDLFGRHVAETVIARLHAKLQGMAGHRGLVARTGTGRFALLLPGREADAALALVRTGFGPTGSLEHDGEHELVLLPAFKVDVVGIDQRSIAAVHDELCRAVSAMVQPIAPALWPGPEPAQRAGPYVPTIPLPLQLQ